VKWDALGLCRAEVGDPDVPTPIVAASTTPAKPIQAAVIVVFIFRWSGTWLRTLAGSGT
jgi:hypothetical protein